MDRRGKRSWTPEQKQAAHDRAIARRDQKSQTPVAETDRERDPEVQAVLDTMSEERKAKLASIQARSMAQLAQTKDGQEALDRLANRHNHKEEIINPAQLPSMNMENVTEPPKKIREIPLKAPFRITGSQSGMCVSEMGPCWCGEPKLKWHPICLKVRI